MKTEELTGRALEWAIATCEGWVNLRWYNWAYLMDNESELVMDLGNGRGTTSLEDMHLLGWNQAGPIIEREKICTHPAEVDGIWEALIWSEDTNQGYLYASQGPTLLVAAMRCYVVSKLGREVDVPKELL